MNREQWQGLMDRLSLGPNRETFRDLHAAYSEKHRHYHTTGHIDHCLGLFEQYRELASRPDEVELALWFHDAIYRPLSRDNEARSAEWARDFVIENGLDDAMVDRVTALIMATVHEAPAEEKDTRLLVDIDLSILGSSEKEYRRFESDVRQEYRWVPGIIYRKERSRILQSFVDRESIYSTPDLRDRFEASARRNLEDAIVRLQS